MEVVIGILTIIYGIIAFIIYHKMFDVYYFGAQGCMNEFFWCLVVGVVLAILTMTCANVVIPIVVILLIISIFSKK